MITCNIFPHTSLQIRSPQALVGKPTQSAKVGEFQLICYQIQTKGWKANNKEIQHLFIFAGFCLFCGFICVLLRVFCVRLIWWFFIIWSWNHQLWSFWWYYAPNFKVTVKFRNSDCWISQVDREASACLLKQVRWAAPYWFCSWESNWVNTSCQDSGTWVFVDFLKYWYTLSNSASGHVSPIGSDAKISRSDMLTSTGRFCLRCGCACQPAMIWQRPWPNPAG